MSERGEREWAEAFGVDFGEPDDTAGRTEPEPVDVEAEQLEVDWTREPRSDDLLSPDVRLKLAVEWT